MKSVMTGKRLQMAEIYIHNMMHHTVPQGTMLCSATLGPTELKSCRIIWCIVQREQIVKTVVIYLVLSTVEPRYGEVGYNKTLL